MKNKSLARWFLGFIPFFTPVGYNWSWDLRVVWNQRQHLRFLSGKQTYEEYSKKSVDTGEGPIPSQMKWLWSRLWDHTPGYHLGSWCPLWLLRFEEWVAKKFPDSWYDQNDDCLPLGCESGCEVKNEPTPLDEFLF